MELDDYFNAVNRIAHECFDREAAVSNYLEQMRVADSNRYNALLRFRQDSMTAADAERAQGYLAIGYFRDLSGAERLAAFILCFDVESEYNWVDSTRRFERYDTSQPLFQVLPGLRDCVRDGELIDYHRLRHSKNDGEVVEHAGRFAIIDRWLNASIVSEVASQFPNVPTFVRLHPFRAYENKPRSLLMEATYRPVNPKWWRNLSLHVGNRDGGEYVLSDHSKPTRENQTEFWDYRIRKIRALQVSCKRDDPAHLTMMAEELSEELLDDGLLVGRCLHFDTDSPVGTDFGKSTLAHLDLALNFYAGERIAERQRQKLADGMVVDASFRCHVYRIEGIPFAAMFTFPLAFFRSRLLPTEWLDNQFNGWRDVFCQGDS
jgi:hypothetical protein